jgi:methylamine dehydrogenase accessory protein MauD
MANAGLEIGTQAPELTAHDLQGQPLTFGGKRGKPALMLFITSSCSTCSVLAPAIRALWKSERDRIEISLISLFSDDEQTRRFVGRYKLTDISCTTSERVGLDYKVTSPPYGLLIDESGMVRAKGIVNNAEHLESLLNVIEIGYPSIQDWYKVQQGAMSIADVSAG